MNTKVFWVFKITADFPGGAPFAIPGKPVLGCGRYQDVAALPEPPQSFNSQGRESRLGRLSAPVAFMETPGSSVYSVKSCRWGLTSSAPSPGARETAPRCQQAAGGALRVCWGCEGTPGAFEVLSIQDAPL